MTQTPIYQQPLHTPQGPPPSPLQPPVAGPPPAGGSRKKWLLLAALIGVGVLFVGAAGAGLVWLLSGHTSDDPLLAGLEEMSLPNHMDSFVTMPVYRHDNYQHMPAAVVTSTLARICGGQDVASTFLRAKGSGLRRVSTLGLFDVLQSSALRTALQCADEFRATMEDPRFASVSWKDGDQTRNVILAQATASQLALARHSFSGLSGHCVTGDDGHCTPGGPAALRLDDHHWAFGHVEAITAFARANQSSSHEPGTKEVILRQLSAELDAFDFSVVLARPEHVDWRQICTDAAVGDNDATFVAACFPSGQERVIESIETKVRGVASQWDAIGTHDAIHYRITLLARDEAAAESIERDLTDLHRDWSSQLSNEESTMVRELEHVPDQSPDVTWRAAIPALTRAVRDAEIERDGELVILDMHAELDPGERTQMTEMRQNSAELTTTLARVLDAIRTGQPPTRADLEHFVTPAVAGWMLAPRASEADCQAVQDHLAQLIQGGVAPELFGIKYAVDQHYGPEHCVGRVLAEGTVQCLTGAGDLRAMAACPLPPSPFALELISAIGGQWQAGNVSGYGNYRMRRSLRSARLEIADGQLALDLGMVQTIPLQVEATSETEGTLSLPIDGAQKVQVVMQNGAIAVSGLPGGLSVRFDRANFEPSLFSLPAVAQ